MLCYHFIPQHFCINIIFLFLKSISYFRFVAGVCLLKLASSDPAKLRREGGVQVTSSTLKWENMRNNQIPIDAVPIAKDDLSKVWCRTKQHGTYASGFLYGGVCTVPFLNAVYSTSDNIEVLVSVNGSARILRLKWDKFQPPPINAIICEKEKLLAMSLSEDGQSSAGFMKPGERRASIVYHGSTKKMDSAFILVEDEPVSYELNHINLETHRTESNEDELQLTKVMLINPGPDRRAVEETTSVTVHHLIYWGRVKGTLAGRDSVVVSPDGMEREIVWGDQNRFYREQVVELQAKIPPGTGSYAKVVATIRKTEAPYSGILTALYSDGGKLTRSIRGLHMDQRVVELKAVYSPPHFLYNKTHLESAPAPQILYRLTTTTTSTTTTTTTTPTPTTTAPSSTSTITNAPETPRVAKSQSQLTTDKQIKENDNSGSVASISTDHKHISLIFGMACYILYRQPNLSL